MSIWLAILGLLLAAPAAEAQTVESVLEELSSAGVGGVTGYPESQSCASALGEGGRCVGADRSACAPGLICFRWRAGMGRCEQPSWLALNGEYNANNLLGASAGCVESDAPRPTPPPVASGCDALGSAAEFVGCLGYPGVHNYPASMPCSEALGAGGRCVGADRTACEPGLICYRWSPGMGRCYAPSWFGTTDNDVIQVSTGCAGGSPVDPPPPTASPPPLPPPPPPPVTGDSVPEVFKSSTETCRSTTGRLPAGNPQTSLNVPQKARDLGEYNDGRLQLRYDEIPLGGSYCAAASSNTVVFGGTLIFNNKGKCNLPPTRGGAPCCEMKAWQPNTDGFYYDNCSMTQKIGADGLYYFNTEMPGDESEVGWGPDNKPHIHYQINCSGCDTSDAFDGSSKAVSNKFYPEDLCTLNVCGSPGKQHQADKVADGVYKYDIVL